MCQIGLIYCLSNNLSILKEFIFTLAVNFFSQIKKIGEKVVKKLEKVVKKFRFILFLKK